MHVLLFLSVHEYVYKHMYVCMHALEVVHVYLVLCV